MLLQSLKVEYTSLITTKKGGCTKIRGKPVEVKLTHLVSYRQ